MTHENNPHESVPLVLTTSCKVFEQLICLCVCVWESVFTEQWREINSNDPALTVACLQCELQRRAFSEYLITLRSLIHYSQVFQCSCSKGDSLTLLSLHIEQSSICGKKKYLVSKACNGANCWSVQKNDSFVNQTSNKSLNDFCLYFLLSCKTITLMLIFFPIF